MTPALAHSRSSLDFDERMATRNGRTMKLPTLPAQVVQDSQGPARLPQRDGIFDGLELRAGVYLDHVDVRHSIPP
jgi:hypothetical protein